MEKSNSNGKINDNGHNQRFVNSQSLREKQSQLYNSRLAEKLGLTGNVNVTAKINANGKHENF